MSSTRGEARQGLLGLPTPAPAERPATEAYARLLGETMRTRLGAVWDLGESGATGATGNRYGDAPGHCCIAIAGSVLRSITIETGTGDRVANTRACAEAALRLMVEVVGD